MSLPHLEHFAECVERGWSPDAQKVAHAVLWLYERYEDAIHCGAGTNQISKELLEQLMAQIDDLNAGIASLTSNLSDLGNAVTQLTPAIQALITKAQGAGVDLTAEINAVNDAKTAVAAIANNIAEDMASVTTATGGGAPASGGASTDGGTTTDGGTGGG